ncbi:hypothetical protein ACHAXS_007912 [Conticribra weissflogii]
MPVKPSTPKSTTKRMANPSLKYISPLTFLCMSFALAAYSEAFFAPPEISFVHRPSSTMAKYRPRRIIQATSSPSSSSGKPHNEFSQNNNNNNASKKSPTKKKQLKYKTIAEMMQAMESKPGKFFQEADVSQNKKKKSSRTRKRVERPKQRYLYAPQRMALERARAQMTSGQQGRGSGASADETENDLEGMGGKGTMSTTMDTDGEVDAILSTQRQIQLRNQKQQQEQMEFARSLGLIAATQLTDAIVGDGEEEVPRIVAAVRVDGDGENVGNSITSNSFAYVIYKPAGWSILGGDKKNKKKEKRKESDDEGDDGGTASTEEVTLKNLSKMKRVKAYDEEEDDFTYVEYNEADILAVLTPEEREELMKDGGLNLSDDFADAAKGALARAGDDGLNDDENGFFDDDSNIKKKKEKRMTNASEQNNIPRLKATIESTSSVRPSIVSWLKQLKAEEGTPIKGGRNWVGMSGAVEVDDTGLVLLCPRDRMDALHVDRAGYVAVVGNGKKLASRSKMIKSIKNAGGGEIADDSTATVDVQSRLRKGRDQDPVLTVVVTFPDGASTCSHAALLCQDQLGEGIRGDPLGDPLDRRAARRLVHCQSMTVTSLVNLEDDPVVVDAGPSLPDDVAIYASRRSSAMYVQGSYLGRQASLGKNGLTNAYREINGAADGYPGWIVDRYDKWLFVQQDEGSVSVRGPLPSLHDGYTAGVYYLPTKSDRSIMGTTDKVKPMLLEGRAAPESIPVLENGIQYFVNLGESFSTGIFLDQRVQRAWLAEHCTSETRVLNCFAHTGAFSVAAATAGASTVSMDLDKKWLDRIRPQMEANGIEWDGRHDCIYGDCFDWLARLAKRNEQFDIVILDPPSTSVGKKKRRWSVKHDMAELVALAAPLVKSEGLLWTTTNSASLRPEKFAKMCKKGLSDAGIPNAKLERVSPMPSDYPSIGTQPVTNLSWRIP